MERYFKRIGNDAFPLFVKDTIYKGDYSPHRDVAQVLEQVKMCPENWSECDHNGFPIISEVDKTVAFLKPSDSNRATRYNKGKLKWSLVHYKSLEPLVKVLMFGAEKYEAHNWKKDMDTSEILESLQRHLASLMDGDLNDEESKLHHIGHIMCNAMFYQYHYEKQNGNK